MEQLLSGCRRSTQRMSVSLVRLKAAWSCWWVQHGIHAVVCTDKSNLLMYCLLASTKAGEVLLLVVWACNFVTWVSVTEYSKSTAKYISLKNFRINIYGTGSTHPDCIWTTKFCSHMEPSATSTTVTGPVGERLQAGTEDAPVLDRPVPLGFWRWI